MQSVLNQSNPHAKTAKKNSSTIKACCTTRPVYTPATKVARFFPDNKKTRD